MAIIVTVSFLSSSVFSALQSTNSCPSHYRRIQQKSSCATPEPVV